MGRRPRPTRAAAVLVAALAGLLVAASTTAAPAREPAPAGAPRGEPRELQAAVPQSLLKKLAAFDELLDDLISRAQSSSNPKGYLKGRAQAGQLDFPFELVELFPDVFGIQFRFIWGDLRDADRWLLEARLEREPARVDELLEKAEKRIGDLQKRLQEASDKGQPVPGEVLTDLAVLRAGIHTLRRQYFDGEIDGLELEQRIDELEKDKHSLLGRFPPLYGLAFRTVYTRLETVWFAMRAAKRAALRGDVERVLSSLRTARFWKQLLEQDLRAQAVVLALETCVRHLRLPSFPGRGPLGDGFRAELRTVIRSEPRTKLTFTATASEPDAFAGGADSSTGTTTLGKRQTVTVATAEIVKPVTFTVEVRGTRKVTLPPTRPSLAASVVRTKTKTVTKTYTATAEADGAPCPGDTAPPPGEEPPPGDRQELECEAAWSFFDPTEVVATGSCRLAAVPGRPALGVSITRLDFELPGGRQVTNWLDPDGFDCAPATRTATNDTLRCAGSLALGATFRANIRSVPGPTAAMGGNLYVTADGAEQGPFPITGP